MKTSNIILSAFCILFLVYVFGIAAEIRFRGEKKQMNINNGFQQLSEGCTSEYKKDMSLPPFKVLKINKITEVGYIRFNAQASNTFSVYATSEEQLPEIEYSTAGDTLFIKKMNKKALCNQFKLELAEPPLEIIVDSMRIDLSSTSDNLKRLNLKGLNTSFQLFSMNTGRKAIDSIHLDLDNNSSIFSHSTVLIKHMEGEILNNSKIELWNSKVESAKVEIGRESQFAIEDKLYDNPDASVQLIYQKEKPKDNSDK